MGGSSIKQKLSELPGDIVPHKKFRLSNRSPESFCLIEDPPIDPMNSTAKPSETSDTKGSNGAAATTDTPIENQDMTGGNGTAATTDTPIENPDMTGGNGAAVTTDTHIENQDMTGGMGAAATTDTPIQNQDMTGSTGDAKAAHKTQAKAKAKPGGDGIKFGKGKLWAKWVKHHHPEWNEKEKHSKYKRAKCLAEGYAEKLRNNPEHRLEGWAVGEDTIESFAFEMASNSVKAEHNEKDETKKSKKKKKKKKHNKKKKGNK